VALEERDQWERWARSYFRTKAAKKRAKHARKMRCLRLKWRLEAQQAAGLDSVDAHRLHQQYERSRPRDALGRYLPKDRGGVSSGVGPVPVLASLPRMG
jgi:hypothetical protein